MIKSRFPRISFIFVCICVALTFLLSACRLPTPNNADLVLQVSHKQLRFYDIKSKTSTALVKPTEGCLVNGPAVSPDSTKIVYSAQCPGPANLWDIYITDPKEQTTIQLMGDTAQDLSPTWSPDGKKIAFKSDRDDHDEIYVMDADGRNLKRLTYSEDSSSPAWSPDGQWIAYVSQVAGYANIYVTSPDGSQVIQMSDPDGTWNDYFPAWSPGGDQIVFASDRDGNFEIYVMPAIGSELIQLTTSAEHEYAPAWSTSGIAFLRENDVFVTNWPNSDQVDQVTFTGDVFNFDWIKWPPPIPGDQVSD